jgi:nucleoside-diphosphate-sugar epimerase
LTTGETKRSATVRPGRVVVTGAAGLVGQNLIPRLKSSGLGDIVAIDKHRTNSQILHKLHPEIRLVVSDLAHDDAWQEALVGAEALVVAHAQIGGVEQDRFAANNVAATERLIATAKQAEIPYIVHVSSSAVNSIAVDFYTETKKAQETIVLESGIPCAVLRPTLMFGWFDRKHLGWLARFMARYPVFPIPGHGRYLRQPLYAGDFCAIIAACLQHHMTGIYNISGLERIDYIDIIRSLRDAVKLKTRIVRVPYALFWVLLRLYAVYDKDAPFTVNQLEALVAADEFEVIDWPRIFDVTPTRLAEALNETFQHPRYSQIVLEF